MAEVCPFCKKGFYSRVAAIDHIISEQNERFLSLCRRIRPKERKRYERWAAGYILSGGEKLVVERE